MSTLRGTIDVAVTKLPKYMPGHHVVDLGADRRLKEQAVIATIHPVGEVGARYHRSIVFLLVHDGQGSHRLRGYMPLSCGAQIQTARNTIVQTFLDDPDYAGVDWLWLLDADMEFEPDTLDRLIKSAHPKDRPIVGGLCFALMKGDEHEIVPTLYRFRNHGQDNQELARVMDYQLDTMNEVDATGGACLLIHRSVLEKIREDNKPPWPWFEERATGDDYGNSLSEDVVFCLRARAAGFPIFVDTAIKIGHVKPVVIDEAEYVRSIAAQPESPAPTFVVIPVKGRHELTEHLLDQLIDQGQADRIFVYDNGSDTDQYGVPMRGGVDVIPADGMTIYEMWNAGIERALELTPDKRCNIAILNNDLVLKADHWLGRLTAGLRAHPSILASSANYDGRDGADIQAVQSTFKDGGLAGFAFAVRGEAFASGQLELDKGYGWYWGDDDLMQQIAKVGGLAVLVQSAHVEHIGGGSQTSCAGTTQRLGTPELREQAEKDRAYFLAKWNLT